MVRQTGENVYGDDGLLQRGVIVRHLILPAHTRNSLAVLDLLAAEFPGVPVSLMAQYVPMGRVRRTRGMRTSTAASPRASTARCSTT